MTAKTAPPVGAASAASPPPVIETEPTAAAHSCDVCPLRSTAQDVRFDYCEGPTGEGCPSIERQCPSCESYRPQSGWWWGMTWGLITWVCADCRFPPLDALAAARNPDLAASHPALRELVRVHPRFAADVDLDDPDRRFAAAGALSRASSPLVGDPAGSVLFRLAAALRARDFAGRVDVDVSDVDLPARQRVTTALHNAAYSLHTPAPVSPPLAGLLRAWERWVDSLLPVRPQPPTQREREDRDRAVVRRSRERRVD